MYPDPAVRIICCKSNENPSNACFPYEYGYSIYWQVKIWKPEAGFVLLWQI